MGKKHLFKLFGNVPLATWWLSRWLASAWMEEKVLPPIYSFADKLGVPVLALEGFVTGAVFVGLIAWVIISIKSKKTVEQNNLNVLEEIKSTLLNMDSIQRNAASKVSSIKVTPDKAKQVYGDFSNLYGGFMAFIKAMIENVVVNRNIDYMINFFKKTADVLDKNDCGLKSALLGNKSYEGVEIGLAQSRFRLKLNNKKKNILQKNIERICRLMYGVNSSIMFRGIVKSHPRISGDAPSEMMIVLESAEAEMRATLTKMLDDIEIEWAVTELNPEQQALVDSALRMFESE